MLAGNDKCDGKPKGDCGGGTCGTKSSAAAYSPVAAPVSAMLAGNDKCDGKPKGDCGGGTCGTKSVAAAATCPMSAAKADETCDMAATCDKAASCDMAAGSCDMASKKDCGDCEYKKTDLLSTAAAHRDLTLFTLAVQAAGLDESLRKDKDVTVFAPTNSAFELVEGALLASLLTDRNQLRQILMQHIVSGAISAEDACTAGTVKSVLGSEVKLITLEGCNTLTVNGSKVVHSDMLADNGVIHAIDSVLLPGSGTSQATVKPVPVVEEMTDAPTQVASAN
jgi:uncharacterized surface protein with fasciclin (FAS1) repeats